MTPADFSLRALYEALDERRGERGLTWAAAMREINRFNTAGHPIATSTIRGLKDKAVAEGDGVLQMLIWLDRTPESFIPGFDDRDAPRFRLRDPRTRGVLRWDARALHDALNTQRQSRGMTWEQVARDLGPLFSAGTLMNLSKGGRVGFPGVMRLVRWLDQPAAAFTRISPM